MSAGTPRRSCDELGTCQARSPSCAGCHPFAPGAIERHKKSLLSRAQRRELLAFVIWAGLLACTGALAGFLLGVAEQLGLLS